MLIVASTSPNTAIITHAAQTSIQNYKIPSYSYVGRLINIYVKDTLILSFCFGEIAPHTQGVIMASMTGKPAAALKHTVDATCTTTGHEVKISQCGYREIACLSPWGV